MNKTEEKSFVTQFFDLTNKKVYRIVFIVFMLLISILYASFIRPGTFEDKINYLFHYPEGEYQQLEKEYNNIIVENHGFNFKNLSDKNIEYSYSFENNNIEGNYYYDISLSYPDKDISVRGYVSEDFSKKDLTLSRNYKTAFGYKAAHITDFLMMSFIAGLFIPLLILYIFPLICVATIVLFKELKELKNKPKKN